MRQHKYGVTNSTISFSYGMCGGKKEVTVVQPAILGEPKKMISHLFPAGYGVRMFPYPFCTYYFVRTSTLHNKGLLPFGLISEESILLTPRSATEDFLGPVIGWMPASFTFSLFSLHYLTLVQQKRARELTNFRRPAFGTCEKKVSIRATWIVPKTPNN